MMVKLFLKGLKNLRKRFDPKVLRGRKGLLALYAWALYKEGANGGAAPFHAWEANKGGQTITFVGVVHRERRANAHGPSGLWKKAALADVLGTEIWMDPLALIELMGTPVGPFLNQPLLEEALTPESLRGVADYVGADVRELGKLCMTEFSEKFRAKLLRKEIGRIFRHGPLTIGHDWKVNLFAPLSITALEDVASHKSMAVEGMVMAPQSCIDSLLSPEEIFEVYEGKEPREGFYEKVRAGAKCSLRDRGMALTIGSVMDDTAVKTAVMVVGLAHLHGEGNLLRLMEDAGWTLSKLEGAK